MSPNQNLKNFQNIFERIILGLNIVRGVFRTKSNIYGESLTEISIGGVRLGPKYTSDIQTFVRKTQQKFVSCQNKLLANSFFQRKVLVLQQLKVFVW